METGTNLKKLLKVKNFENSKTKPEIKDTSEFKVSNKETTVISKRLKKKERQMIIADEELKIIRSKYLTPKSKIN